MTETLCGAAHPDTSLNVTCQRPPGMNAVKEVWPDIPATASADEVAEIMDQPARTIDVHVHSGRSADGGTHRWEDPTEESPE